MMIVPPYQHMRIAIVRSGQPSLDLLHILWLLPPHWVARKDFGSEELHRRQALAVVVRRHCMVAVLVGMMVVDSC